MGVVDKIFGGNNKLDDCEQDENNNIRCRIGIKHKGMLLNSGSQFEGSLDNSCKFHMTGRSIVLEEDEESVNKAIKRMESNCKGGNKIN